MTVVLTLSNSEEWNTLVERSTISSVENLDTLEKVDESVLVKNAVSVDELRDVLSLYDSVILVYPAIQTVLSNELKAGTDSELAASSAAKLFDELLSTHRTARKKLKMLNMRSLNFATSEELALLSEMGWSLDSNSVEIEDDIFTLAAYQIVHQNKSLKKLADLLMASSIPFGTANEEIKIDIAIGKYSKKLRESETRRQTAEKTKNALLESQQKIGAVEEKLSSVEAEGELLRLQATQLQEELEKYFNLSHELESEKISAVEREQELKDTVETLEKLNGLQVEKISELELTLNDKNKVLLGLESQLNDELIKLELTHDELYKAQKLSGNMESSLAAATSRIDDLNSEIELLKAHLSVVQSELETYFIKATDAEAQNAEAQKEIDRLQMNCESTKRECMALVSKLNEIEEAKRSQRSEHIRETKQLQREYSKLEVKFKHQRGELAKYRHQVERLTSELENIKASGSWKIGAPARAVSKVISKIDRKKLKLRQEAGLIYTSELFDADWYLNTYPDVKSANIDPAEHYLEYGAKEGRLPSASFDGNWYLKRYPDVADSDVNPLVHYLKFGQNEGRSASPVLLENFKN
jgi:chromosome segregation ATPase